MFLAFSSRALTLLCESFRNFVFVLALIFSILFWAKSSYGLQSRVSGILMQAKDFERNGDIVELKGDVQLIFETHHLSSDEATINLSTKQIEARGNVSYLTTETFAQADSASYNYETKLGVFRNGYVQAGQVLFEGEVISKVGDQSFEADRAYFTSCKTCPASWSIRGRRIEAKMGSYAYLKSTTFYILDVPVLWLPYLIVPIKSSRQTGFLPPTLEISRNDLGVGTSFFWAMSENQDSTWSFNKSKRGLKGLLEYRYVLSKESQGRLQSAYLQDKLFRDKVSPNSDNHRWFLSYENHFLLPENIVQNSKVNLVSDLFYPRDFADDIEGEGDPALENRFSVSKNFDQHHLSLDTGLYINLLKEDPLSKNTDAVHRFPEIRYSLVHSPIPKTPLYFSFDANYVNFARQDFSYDDIDPSKPDDPVPAIRDGQFSPETDIMRTGQRLDLSPKLSLPFRLGPYFEVLPELAYRETQYQFNTRPTEPNDSFSSSAARRYLKADLNVKTRVSQVYEFDRDESESVQAIKHEIIPEVTYSRIPWFKRPDHPFFGDEDGQPPAYRISDPVKNSDVLGKRRLQFDYQDRTYDLRTISFGLTNRLIQKLIGESGISTYRQALSLSLTQSYDLVEAEKPDGQPWSDFEAKLKILLTYFETYTVVRHLTYGGESEYDTRVKIKDGSGNFFQVRYLRDFNLNDKGEVEFKDRQESIAFTVGTQSRYINISGSIDYGLNDSRVLSWGYDALIKPPGNCWGIRLRQRQRGLSEPTFHISADFNFGEGSLAGFRQE